MTDLATASASATPTRPSYRHLNRLTDSVGVFEHALLTEPRLEHGYCLDDVARALIVTVREPDQTHQLRDLTTTYLRFINAAIVEDGRAHNRRAALGLWTDQPDLGDWWGRALWACGIAATAAHNPRVQRSALRIFTRAAQQRSPHLHASAFAALGACALMKVRPTHRGARQLAQHYLGLIMPSTDAVWLWPRSRMTYSSGSIAEALVACGTALGDPNATEHGLVLVDFLVRHTTRDGRLSVVGTAGRGADEHERMFDQQPIEVAAIADAAATAFEVTGDPRWLDTVRLAWAWFEGHNDARIPMVDHDNGAGFDGLQIHGRNQNRGAESTLAALSTWQLATRLARQGSAA